MKKRLPKGLRVRTTENETVYTLYQTDIVTFNHRDKLIQLKCEGWYTIHTKKCMNLALNELGYYVRQRKGDWYIETDKTTTEFEDGIILRLVA
jgi:hypothetical protein